MWRVSSLAFAGGGAAAGAWVLFNYDAARKHTAVASLVAARLSRSVVAGVRITAGALLVRLQIQTSTCSNNLCTAALQELASAQRCRCCAAHACMQ